MRSVRFAERQEFYGLAVDEKDVREIDRHSVPFPFQQGTKHIYILPCNPSADAQDHKILSDNKPVDSAAHCRFTFELFPLAVLEPASEIDRRRHDSGTNSCSPESITRLPEAVRLICAQSNGNRDGAGT